MNTLPDASLFRAYDIRGIFGKTLSAEDFYAIGQAFASHVVDTVNCRTPHIVLMRDGRHSSPALAHAMREGMASAGATVLDAGIGPTPMCYFAAHFLAADASVMVTGSHNPKDHNGAKFTCLGASVHGETLRALRTRIETQQLTRGRGHSEEVSIQEEYLAELKKALPIGLDVHDLNIVWDAGNGAAGDVITALTKEDDTDALALYTRIDGDFPHHEPDPSKSSNLIDLQKAVKSRGALIGLAFDGDGDRLGVVDERGKIVSPDHLLMLFAKDVLARKKDATIIADVKTTDAFFKQVAAWGGHPLMWKTGHALIKDKMRETNAAFAGEASGHIFFADEYYGYDDALYAAMRLIRIVVESKRPLSALIEALPVLHSSEEWRIACDDDKKFGIIESLAAMLTKDGASVNQLDGVRVTNEYGWWLIRASNTEAKLVARCEGYTAEGLQRQRSALADYLGRHKIGLPAAA
ncbi:MAG: phosphomannomutase/phosphoglucomutase [Rickettsiales bacterium]